MPEPKVYICTRGDHPVSASCPEYKGGGTPCSPPADAPVFVRCERCARVLRAAHGGATDLDNRHRAPVHCDGVSVPGRPRGWRCRGSCLPAPRVVG